MSRAFTKESDGEPAGAVVLPRADPFEVTPAGLAAMRARAAAAVDPRERAELDNRLEAAIVPQPPGDPDAVAFGARVTVHEPDGTQRVFVLVGDDEIDVARGRIGTRSPLGAALVGRRIGDAVTWHRPIGDVEVVVAQVDYAELRE